MLYILKDWSFLSKKDKLFLNYNHDFGRLRKIAFSLIHIKFERSGKRYNLCP